MQSSFQLNRFGQMSCYLHESCIASQNRALILLFSNKINLPTYPNARTERKWSQAYSTYPRAKGRLILAIPQPFTERQILEPEVIEFVGVV